MRETESGSGGVAALALLAQLGSAEAAPVSVRQDEGAFSGIIEARAERSAADVAERERALALAADQAYRAVLAAGGDPELGPHTQDFLELGGGWLARAGARGRIKDVRKLASWSFVEAGDFAYVLGSASDSSSVSALYEAIRSGVSGRMLRTCRAIGAPGGLVLGIAAACFPGSLGLRVLLDDLPGAPADAEGMLFGTGGSRCIAGARREDRERFERSFGGIPHRLLGVLTREPGVVFVRNGRTLLELRAIQSAYAATVHW